MQLLYKAKEALHVPFEQRVLQKVIILSSSGLLTDVKRSIIRYFSDDSVSIGYEKIGTFKESMVPT